MIAGAKPRIARAGTGGPLRHRDGRLLQGGPGRGDAYIMKHIIHDWDDERALDDPAQHPQRADGSRDGRVILLEAVLQPGNAPGSR